MKTARFLGLSVAEPQTKKADLNKLSGLLQPGHVVDTLDGRQFRVASKIAGEGLYSFRLADLQGKPVQIPANFHPVTAAFARVAAWMRFVFAYNKDFDLYVKEYIKEAGLPVDEKMNWAKWFQYTYPPKLSGASKDPEIIDEAIHQVIITALAHRKDLTKFDPKRLPEGAQAQPLAEQVTTYLQWLFKKRVSEAYEFITEKLQPKEEISMWQPSEDEEADGETNILDTEEHAEDADVKSEEAADLAGLRDQFAAWLAEDESEREIEKLLVLYDFFTQNVGRRLKISDYEEYWKQRTGLGFDSLKPVFAKFYRYIPDFMVSAGLIDAGKAQSRAVGMGARASSLRLAAAEETHPYEGLGNTICNREGCGRTLGDPIHGGERAVDKKAGEEDAVDRTGDKEVDFNEKDAAEHLGRKCDDCGKKWATERVGGRKLCKDCAQNARERKEGSEKQAEVDMGQVPSVQDKQDQARRQKSKPVNGVSTMRPQASAPGIRPGELLAFGYHYPDGSNGRQELKWYKTVSEQHYRAMVKSIMSRHSDNDARSNALFAALQDGASSVDPGTSSDSVIQQFKTAKVRLECLSCGGHYTHDGGPVEDKCPSCRKKAKSAGIGGHKSCSHTNDGTWCGRCELKTGAGDTGRMPHNPSGGGANTGPNGPIVIENQPPEESKDTPEKHTVPPELPYPKLHMQGADKKAGQWGTRSWDSDQVHDILDKYRPGYDEKPDNEGFDEPIPEENVSLVLSELDQLENKEGLTTQDPNKDAAGNRGLIYLGVVVFLLEHGAEVPDSYRSRALAYAQGLLDEKNLSEWKDSADRKASLEKEIDLLKTKTADGGAGNSGRREPELDRNESGWTKHPSEPDYESDEFEIEASKKPSKEAIEAAMRDAEREGAPMDAAELAAEFGITEDELYSILEGQEELGPNNMSEEAAQEVLDAIRPGDRVTILVPAGKGRQGQEWAEQTGRAVMRGPAGWVLNMGGAHGTPGVATTRNILRVRQSKKSNSYYKHAMEIK